MKFLISITLAFYSCSALIAQNREDLHYNLLDSIYKNINSETQLDYIILELENYTLIYPNSVQEDEILFRLSHLYGLKTNKAQQLKTLIKLNILHADSPLIKRSVEIVDSLVTFTPQLNLTEFNENTIRQLSNLSNQGSYRLAYLEFLSFLYSAKIDVINNSLLLEINHYKILFFSENKDMDAVLFWQAEIYKRGKNYPAAILNFNKVCDLYKQSSFVPHAILELARLNTSYLKDIDRARDHLIELINQYPNTKVTGDAQFELAKLYEIHYKDKQEALTNYKLQVSAFPDNENHFSALVRIAFISEQLGDYTEALNSNMRIVENNGDDKSISTAFKNIIRLHLEKVVDYNMAAKTMLLYSQTFPKRDDAAKNLLLAGKLYLEKSGKNKDAQKVFAIIMKQYPHSKEAKEAKKLLKKK